MKTTTYFLLTLLFFATTSCTVDVPDDHDETRLSLYINGDGFEHTFTAEEDPSRSMQLNLRSDVEYEFKLYGYHRNGLGYLGWSWNTETIETGMNLNSDLMLPNIPDRWFEDLRNTYYRVLTDTDPADVPREAVLTGTVTFYTATDVSENINLDFNLVEFVGPGSSSGVAAINILGVIGEHPTALVPRD